MHPSFSVIFFTVASGAGYGLLFWLAVLVMLNAIPVAPADPWFGFLAMGAALGLITFGLMSSTQHLGHPERAWRAFSQWRSSWLSREGVMAVLTYLPAGLLGLSWVFWSDVGGVITFVALLAAIGAWLTVLTTGMIYASLKPVPEWHTPYTMPGYLLLAAATGAVLVNAFAQGFAVATEITVVFAVINLAAAWAWKTATWCHQDALKPTFSAGDAVGLPGSEVKVLELPHGERNYLLKEMGFVIGRRHAAKLRRLVHGLLFAAPILLLLLGLFVAKPGGVILAMLACCSAALGVVIERWLFFAEATHLVQLYYGVQRAV
jgi:DMSO reductase anchor subunit